MKKQKESVEEELYTFLKSSKGFSIIKNNKEKIEPKIPSIIIIEFIL